MKRGALLLGAAGLCGLAFQHPFVTYPLSLRLLRPAPVGEAPAGAAPPSFSLLFCAHNEIGCLEQKLDNLRALRRAHPGLEVLAYDDASTDGTYEALRAWPDLVRVVRGPGRTGKAHGMKTLAAQATGDALVFTDANVMLDPAALDVLGAAYADPAVGGVCGRLLYTTSHDHTPTEQVGGLYWRLEEALKEAESRTGNVMGADGSVFSVRRALYPDFPDAAQDDFVVSMSVVFAGHRLVRRADAVARETLVASAGEEFRRKVRIAAGAHHTHRHMRPRLRRLPVVDRYKYFSHKVLRWHSATSLTACVAFTAMAARASAPRPVAPRLLLGTTAAVLVGVRLARPAAWHRIREVLLALLATNVGVWQDLRGRTYQTWQPPPR